MQAPEAFTATLTWANLFEPAHPGKTAADLPTNSVGHANGSLLAQANPGSGTASICQIFKLIKQAAVLLPGSKPNLTAKHIPGRFQVGPISAGRIAATSISPAQKLESGVAYDFGNPFIEGGTVWGIKTLSLQSCRISASDTRLSWPEMCPYGFPPEDPGGKSSLKGRPLPYCQAPSKLAGFVNLNGGPSPGRIPFPCCDRVSLP